MPLALLVLVPEPVKFDCFYLVTCYAPFSVWCPAQGSICLVVLQIWDVIRRAINGARGYQKSVQIELLEVTARWRKYSTSLHARKVYFLYFVLYQFLICPSDVYCLSTGENHMPLAFLVLVPEPVKLTEISEIASNA